MRGPICTECGWERPARSQIHAVPGELQEFDPKSLGQFEPRSGLRAECTKDPKVVWRAALAFAFERSRKGPDHARRWAYGVWKGVYPSADRLPRGWYQDAPPPSFDPNAYALVEREVKRFRKGGRKAA